MKLSIVTHELAVCRLPGTAALPPWATSGGFYSVCRTPTELSVVCEAALAPNDVRVERSWRALMVEGPLDFSLVGILASLASTLAEAQISIFAISTFDTDYVLVKTPDLPRAIVALEAAGHAVARDG